MSYIFHSLTTKWTNNSVESRVRMKDSELRNELKRLHQQSYGWALTCCYQNSNEAQDVLQTVYLKILVGKAKFSQFSTFKTWLFAVIKKTAVNDHRKRKARKLLNIQFQQKLIGRQVEKEIEENIDISQLRFYLRKLLNQLPLRQQEVLQLVFYHDMTIQEAASIMSVSIGTARTHYERGKKKLGLLIKNSQVFYEIRS